MKQPAKPARRRGRLHTFSRHVLFGTVQLTLILYALTVAIYVTAPLSPQYFRSVACYTGLAEIAPVTLAAGVVAALVSDLALRPRSDEDSSDHRQP